MKERWRVIHETNGAYEASNMGRIRRRAGKQGTRPLRLLDTSKGKVNLSYDGIRINRSVRQVLAATWPEYYSYGYYAKRSGPEVEVEERKGRAKQKKAGTAYYDMIRAELPSDIEPEDVKEAIINDISRRVAGAFADLDNPPHLVPRMAMKGMYLYISDAELSEIASKVQASQLSAAVN